MEQLRILIDMDGVLVETMSLWLQEYNNLTGETVRPSDITEYNFGKFVRYPELFFGVLEIARIFERSQPMPGACEGVRRLIEQGHDVQIVSYVHESAPSGYEQKLEWLNVWLPEISPRQVTFCYSGQKQYIQGDILVEDYPSTISAWLERGGFSGSAYLVNHSYNADAKLPRTERVTSVKDVADLLQFGHVRLAS